MTIKGYYYKVLDVADMQFRERFEQECGEGGVVQRSLQREKDSGDGGK